MIPSVEESQLTMVLKEPYGVVGAIVPWNYPILLMAWKVAPALAAGNTVVLKPSEMTPLSTLLFAELFEHLPPGVINIVSGYGKDCGEPLVLDRRVRVIAFTGSQAMGQRIAQLVAPQMKKLHLVGVVSLFCKQKTRGQFPGRFVEVLLPVNKRAGESEG